MPRIDRSARSIRAQSPGLRRPDSRVRRRLRRHRRGDRAGARRSAARRVVVAGRDAAKARRARGALRDRRSRRARRRARRALDVASIRAAVDDAAATPRRASTSWSTASASQRIEPLADVTEEAFDRVYDVNLKAAMFLAQAVGARADRRGRGGRHVHLLSVRAQLGMRDRGYSAYCSSKGGLVLLVKQHAVELARARHHRQRRRADGRAHARWRH